MFRASWCRSGLIWDRFGIDLGSIWDRFGIDLGSIWDRSGIDLGSIRDRSGIDPVSIWHRSRLDLSSFFNFFIFHFSIFLYLRIAFVFFLRLRMDLALIGHPHIVCLSPPLLCPSAQCVRMADSWEVAGSPPRPVYTYW